MAPADLVPDLVPTSSPGCTRNDLVPSSPSLDEDEVAEHENGPTSSRSQDPGRRRPHRVPNPVITHRKDTPMTDTQPSEQPTTPDLLGALAASITRAKVARRAGDVPASAPARVELERPHVVEVGAHGIHRCLDCGAIGEGPPPLPCPGVITDRAAIRDSVDEREPERLPATGLVVVQLQAELADVRYTLRLRSDALARVSRENEALRAKVAAVEALAEEWQDAQERGVNGRHGYHCSEYGNHYADDVRAALATGEGK